MAGVLLLAGTGSGVAHAADVFIPVTLTFQNQTEFPYTLTLTKIGGCPTTGFTKSITVPARPSAGKMGQVQDTGKIQVCGTKQTTVTFYWDFSMTGTLGLGVESGTWKYEITNVGSKNRTGSFTEKTSDNAFLRSIRSGRMNVERVSCGIDAKDLDMGRQGWYGCGISHPQPIGKSADLLVRVIWVAQLMRSIQGYSSGRYRQGH
jgi:hypothetical protein